MLPPNMNSAPFTALLDEVQDAIILCGVSLGLSRQFSADVVKRVRLALASRNDGTLG